MYSDTSQTSTIAPVFDCGSCLLPQADDKVMHAVLEDERELHARIFRFPTSVIKCNDQKINYYDFLIAVKNRDCNAALLRMVPRINEAAIHSLIDETPYLTDLQRTFYKSYLDARFDMVLAPAYDMVMDQRHGFSSMQML